ncbi:hypothetical protein DK182_01320 [Streptococcus sobrinus]|uniref:Transposase n=1 Tax=Streptococcus sobrinus TaxID=1310 RepID=A0ABN5LKQ3_9STRE|nr:hypothetical protein DK182_01320 [Streptococcus sobrinus]
MKKLRKIFKRGSCLVAQSQKAPTRELLVGAFMLVFKYNKRREAIESKNRGSPRSEPLFLWDEIALSQANLKALNLMTF